MVEQVAPHDKLKHVGHVLRYFNKYSRINITVA